MAAPEAQGTGYIGGLCVEQHNALRDVRACLGEEIHHPRFTDPMLLRFLRAKNFDVEKATEALRNHLDFRKQNNLDAISAGRRFCFGCNEEKFPELLSAVKRYYPHGYHGMDREGRPVYIERLGELDPKGLLSVATTEQILEYFTYESELTTIDRLPSCSLATGRLVETSMSILDLKGLSFKVVSNSTIMKMVQALSKEQEEHFPSVMSTMVIVNAPAVFSMAWSAIKPFLDPRTVDCIQIFSAGQFADARERLLELIAPEELPPFLGGCCCKCEGDCLLSNRGPWSDPDIQQHFATNPYWEVVDHFVAGSSSSSGEEKLGSEEPCPDVDANKTQKSDTLGQCFDEEGTETDDGSTWYTPQSSEAGDFIDEAPSITDEELEAETPTDHMSAWAMAEGNSSQKAIWRPSSECNSVSGRRNSSTSAFKSCDTPVDDGDEAQVVTDEDLLIKESGNDAVEECSLVDAKSLADVKLGKCAFTMEPEEEPEDSYKTHILFTALLNVNDGQLWTPRFKHRNKYNETSVMDSMAERFQPFMEYASGIDSVVERFQPFMEYAPSAWWNCAGQRSKERPDDGPDSEEHGSCDCTHACESPSAMPSWVIDAMSSKESLNC